MSKMKRTTTIMQSGNSHITIYPKPILELMELRKGDKILWDYDTDTKELILKPERTPD